jgi:mannose-6-phosphate isomerase-like protein (cupin superfamily)
MTTNDFYAKYNFETHPKIFETVHMYYEKGSNYPKEKMDHRLKDRIWYFENYDHFKELTAARNASIP